MQTAEIPEFNLDGFSSDFFAGYENDLAAVRKEAPRGLENILKVQNSDGSEKTIEQMRYESRAFFANELIQRDEVLMNQLATQFAAQICRGHMHGAALSSDTTLSSVFEKGVINLFSNKHEHNSEGHSHDDDDEEEVDSITGKRKKRKKYRR